MLQQRGSDLVIPPHKTGNFQFTAQQNTFGYQVAKLRVHVERAIARIKIYEILDFVTHDLEPYMDYILPVICFLSNNQSDLIKPKSPHDL